MSFLFLNDTNLEEVILMHHAAVGQVLAQTVSQGSFTPISHSDKHRNNRVHYLAHTE